MSPCLSDTALMRVIAELATAAEREHLAACRSCADRYRQLDRELDLIGHVLAETPEPRPRAAPGSRRWRGAVVGLSAAAIALLVWVEVAVWRALSPPPAVPPQEVAAVLADVSRALFSVSGDPAPEDGLLEAGDLPGTGDGDLAVDGNLGDRP